MGVHQVTRGRQLPAWLVDAVLGIGVAIVLTVVISADQGGRQDPDLVAYLWAAGLGALMLARRYYPVLVLLVTALGLFAYYAAGYPAVGLAVPVAAALFSAAELGRVLWAVGTGVGVTVISVFFRLVEGQDFTLVVGYELAGHVVLMAAAIAFGDSLRSRRVSQANARKIVELTESRARQDADARRQAERLAIARDLHDSVGHTTSVISLHADVAREAIGRQDDKAREALALIKATAGLTMSELRATVVLLRSGKEERPSATSLNDLSPIIQRALHAGIAIKVDNNLRTALPPLAEVTVYRIIQESVTNIVKHSTAAGASVTIGCVGDLIRVTVIDDGSKHSELSGNRPDTGYGIAGMRERAEVLGGTLSADFEGVGFAVRATIPMPRETL